MIPHSKPFVGYKELEFVNQAMHSQILINGGFKEKFLESISNYLGVSEVYYSQSGTDALIFLLKALNLKEHAEIILPTYVCEGVYYGVLEAGYIPVLCDIGESWNTTADKIKEKISDKTGAIIMVYIFGLIGDIDEILTLGYPVIEDVCQSFGLKINGRIAGTLGTAAFCSFGAIKCLTAGGVGGCAFSSRKDINQKMKNLEKISFVRSELSEMNAAYGLAQIENYEYFLLRRAEIASQYNGVFSDIKHVKQLSFNMGINYRFVTKVSCDPEIIMKEISNYGITLRKGVDQLLHKKFGIEGDYSNSEEAYKSTVSWPIYPALDQEEVEYIITVIKKIFKNAPNKIKLSKEL